jgi:ribosomal protein S26
MKAITADVNRARKQQVYSAVVVNQKKQIVNELTACTLFSAFGSLARSQPLKLSPASVSCTLHLQHIRILSRQLRRQSHTHIRSLLLPT